MSDYGIQQPTDEERQSWGKRADGSPKGLGYFGVIKRPDGMVSSELSIGVNMGGKEVEIPSLVPTLSRDELDHLLKGGAPTPEIVRKAADFASQRMQQGQSVWATPQEEGKTALPAAPEPGLIDRAIKGVRDINVFDALHPQGTGTTKRGFSDIYPPVGK